MPAKVYRVIVSVLILLGSLAAIANDDELMEVIEFLGEWTDEKGGDIDFEMFKDSQHGHSPPQEDVRAPDQSRQWH